MKIAFVTKDLAVNGANRMVQELAARLGRQTHEVVVYTSAEPRQPWLHEPLDVRPVQPGVAQGFDVVCSCYFTVTSILDEIGEGRRVQLLMDDYSRYGAKSHARRHLIEYAYWYPADVKLSVSYWLRDQLGARGIRSTVWHAGVDPAVFFGNSATRDATSPVLVEGYHRTGKRLPETYEAIPRQFEIWGLGPEDHRNRASRMFVQPPQEALRDVYSSCFAFVKLERGAGFPQAPLEAMACGCPVICSDVGGHRDYCVGDFNCLLVAADTEVPGCLARLASDRALRDRLIQNGLATAAAFTWDRSVDTFRSSIEPSG